MNDITHPASSTGAIPVHPVDVAALATWLADAPAAAKAWVTANDFTASPGSHLIVPGDDGDIAGVLCGVSTPPSVWDMASLPTTLPDATFVLSPGPFADRPAAIENWVLGWMLGSYRFDRYKTPSRVPARLVPPKGVDTKHVDALAEGTCLVRDLVNTPANDLGPTALAAAAKTLAERYDAAYSDTVGDDLLAQSYPAIHAVGRAAADAPRLIELTWGDPAKPTLALVGKGVCFDTGGLDIKPAGGMKLMKKDMGGAAHVLGIALYIMQTGVDVHLKVLVPAVENAISGNAMRPLDVIRTRAGITIEIGNTDAEGRVILADALTRAGEASPDLVIDFATLTGAARVALGTELPALFCNDDGVADGILSAAKGVEDSLWRLPLWPGYRKMIEAKTADITNAPDGGYAGAITAALFLERFVDAKVPWAHIDVMSWNTATKPGRPEGGEAMGLRAFAAYLGARYGYRT